MNSVIDLIASPVPNDAKVRRNQHIIATLRAIQPHMKALGGEIEGTQAAGLSAIQTRRIELCGIHDFIESASLIECRNIIGSLIERVSTLTGGAHELEDAFDVIGREIAAESDPSDSLRSHMERRDEA